MTSLILPEPKRVVRLECLVFHPCGGLESQLAHARDVARYRMRRERGKFFIDAFETILLMASGKTAYLSEKVKNNVLGQVAMPTWGTTFTALWTTAATTDMDAFHGGTAGEVSGGSYDRVSKTNNTTNYASITGDAAKVNSNAHTFPTASANWNSGSNIPQMMILDGNAKSAADNALVWGDLTVAKPVLSGDTAQFNTSAISYTEE